MAIIIPNVVPNASLSSSLITPGWPLVVVPMASPIAKDVLAEPNAPVATPTLSATHLKVLVQSGHIADRII
jgi:hypothetical protein